MMKFKLSFFLFIVLHLTEFKVLIIENILLLTMYVQIIHYFYSAKYNSHNTDATEPIFKALNILKLSGLILLNKFKL